MIDELEKNIENILSIAAEASEAIIKIYENDFQVTYKKDQSPLTLADQNAHKIITASLHKLFPAIPIISEEEKYLNYDLRKHWEYCWLIDPLDGTKEFVKRNNEFCINIALIKNSKPIFGLICQPVNQITHFNIENKIFVQQNNSIEEILIERNDSKILKIISSRSHPSLREQALVADFKKKGFQIEYLVKGSAIKFCSLVNGEADIYPRFAPTMEWDTAAGHALVLANGGNVLIDSLNLPLSYNKENLLNPSFIAFNKSIKYLFA